MINKDKTLILRISSAQLDKLEEYAKDHGINRSKATLKLLFSESRLSLYSRCKELKSPVEVVTTLRRKDYHV